MKQYIGVVYLCLFISTCFGLENSLDTAVGSYGYGDDGRDIGTYGALSLIHI
jgi:hypothetical protein